MSSHSFPLSYPTAEALIVPLLSLHSPIQTEACFAQASASPFHLPTGPDCSRLYQPTITRLPSLLCLFFFTLSLIALTELACRRLPPAQFDGVMMTIGDEILPRLARRVLASKHPGPYDDKVRMDNINDKLKFGQVRIRG